MSRVRALPLVLLATGLVVWAVWPVPALWGGELARALEEARRENRPVVVLLTRGDRAAAMRWRERVLAEEHRLRCWRADFEFVVVDPRDEPEFLTTLGSGELGAGLAILDSLGTCRVLRPGLPEVEELEQLLSSIHDEAQWPVLKPGAGAGIVGPTPVSQRSTP